MAVIEFSALNYYTSVLSEECITLGLLYHNHQTDERFFRITSNWKRVASFDDEMNIEFVKDYLKGIKSEVENNLFNHNQKFKLRDYVKFYVNEFRFSPVQVYDADNENQFIENTMKIFMKFDFDKSQRLGKQQEKEYIKALLKSNHIEYSNQRITGKHDEDIGYDYIIADYGIKIFTFEGRKLSYLISTAKAWAYTAYEMKGNIKTVFIFDVEMINDRYFEAILSILKENAYSVMNWEEGIKFLTSINKIDLRNRECI